MTTTPKRKMQKYASRNKVKRVVDDKQQMRSRLILPSAFGLLTVNKKKHLFSENAVVWCRCCEKVFIRTQRKPAMPKSEYNQKSIGKQKVANEQNQTIEGDIPSWLSELFPTQGPLLNTACHDLLLPNFCQVPAGVV